MPMVNGKKYAYTKTGMAAAKKAASKSGKTMTVKPTKKAVMSNSKMKKGKY